MKIHVVCGCFILFVVSGFCSSAYVDSTNMIFDSSKVYTYRLDFYIQDWQKQLQKNFDSGKLYMPAKFTYGNMVLDSIGVRYKGNSSQAGSSPPRKPYKLKFDKYKDQTFFELKKLSLSNSYKDPSFMRERICYSVARRYVPASRTSYLNLYVGDTLIGFYIQVEDIDKQFLKRHFKKDKSDTPNNLYSVENDGAPLEYWGDDKKAYDTLMTLETNDSLNDWTAFIAMIKAMNTTPDDQFETAMKTYLNIDGAMRILALDMVMSRFDSYTGSGRNYFFYDDSASKCFQMIPWDFNEGFGCFTNGWDVIKQDVTAPSNLNHRPLNRRIIEIPALQQRYLRYIRDMINGPFSLDSVTTMINQTKPLIDPYVKADSKKPCSYQDFLDNSEKDIYNPKWGALPGLKSFIQKRTAELRIQLDKKIGITNFNHAVHTLQLLQVSDNPLNGMITIRFTATAGAIPTSVTLYNSKGVAIRQFVTTDKNQSGKTFQYAWDGASASSGYYFLEVSNGQLLLARQSFIIVR
ncbi:MAG: CotH kinase family protein [Chitinivibrionales bacterium]|nr:CotH kinase family protein [Chitinivibrionales bacterium]